MKKQTPAAKPALARPTPCSNTAQHFHAPEARRATAIILHMAKAKRSVGRPKIGERYLVVLPDDVAEKARQVGGGNLSAGLRRFAEAYQAPRRKHS